MRASSAWQTEHDPHASASWMRTPALHEERVFLGIGAPRRFACLLKLQKLLIDQLALRITEGMARSAVPTCAEEQQ